jgi:serine/threonine protein kinase
MEQIIREYRQIRYIGGGAYGAIFLVEHTRTNLRYAMKIPNLDPETQENINRETENEITILTNIAHPFVISMVESFPMPGDPNNRKCIVMEYA